MEHKEIIEEKLNYFLNNSIKVHITKFNKEFLNGKIYSKLSNEIYLVREDRQGNIKVFLNEIFDIDEFKEKRENEK